MLNICIVFAQMERETIQKRVSDAYYSRCQRGFHMSGAAPFGFKLEPATIQGIRTKMMVPDPDTANIARLMFEMYAEPSTSFGDIARYFAENNILIYGKELKRGFISQLLRNPIYAQADLELYEFFKDEGAVVVNDAADFAGTNFTSMAFVSVERAVWHKFVQQLRCLGYLNGKFVSGMRQEES